MHLWRGETTVCSEAQQLPSPPEGGVGASFHARWHLCCCTRRVRAHSWAGWLITVTALSSLRLLNHHYTILSQRFFLLENCKKSVWKRERQRFLDKVPAEVFDTRTCVEQQQWSARKGFHPVAPQSSCLPSFSQVTFCKFHRFLGPKTPNWISCFKYTFLPLFITSETFCSAE